MAPSVGVQLFWMIALGLVVGYAGYFIYQKRGVDLGFSLAISTLGAVVMGLITYYASFDLPMMYAALGAVTFLFVTNVFLQKG